MLKKLLLLLLIVAPIHADDQSFLDAVSRPVLYSVPGLNNIRVRRDVIYRTEP